MLKTFRFLIIVRVTIKNRANTKMFHQILLPAERIKYCFRVEKISYTKNKNFTRFQYVRTPKCRFQKAVERKECKQSSANLGQLAYNIRLMQSVMIFK